MARRRTSKPKKVKAVNNSPISERTRKNLTRQLSKARSRIKNLIDKYGSEYSGPSVEDFYLQNVLTLIESGTHINSIYAMIRNANAKSYAKNYKSKPQNADPIVSQMYGGIPVHQSQYTRLFSAIAKANRNIDAVRSELGELGDILPQPLELDDVLKKVTSTNRLNDVIKVINTAFTKKKLTPIAISDTGEAGTIAEIEFFNSFITEENRKRKIAREDVKDILETRGLFKTHQEFALEDVNTSTWDTMEKWRRRTNYFTDASALNKAFIWKENYLTSFETLEANARDAGLFKTPGFSEKIEQIKEYVNLLHTEEQVRALVRFSDYIEIQQNYKETAAQILNLVDNLLYDWGMFYQTHEIPKERQM